MSIGPGLTNSFPVEDCFGLEYRHLLKIVILLQQSYDTLGVLRDMKVHDVELGVNSSLLYEVLEVFTILVEPNGGTIFNLIRVVNVDEAIIKVFKRPFL